MGTKYFVDQTATYTDSRIRDSAQGAIHLSDGTLVFLDYINATNNLIQMFYTTDRSAVNYISSPGFIVSPVQYASFSITDQAVTLVRDSSDNIYVIWVYGNVVSVRGYTKGTGYTWTETSAWVSGTGWTGSISSISATWCNTGGGTSGKGHLMVVGISVSGAGLREYQILDAGTALGLGGTLTTQQAANPTFLGGSAASPAGLVGNCIIDLDNDGFGAASGVAATITNTPNLSVGAWSVTSAGVLSTNTQIGTYTSSAGTARKVRVVRYAANAFAVIYPSSSTAANYMVARFSATAQLTAGTDSGTPTNMSMNGTNSEMWDAFLDPSLANTIWIVAKAGSANVSVYQTAVTLTSGVSWASAAVLADTLTSYVADDTSSACGGSGTGIRAVKKPIGALNDFHISAAVSSGPTTPALMGLYATFAAAPAAPTLTSPTNNAFTNLSAGVPLASTYNPTDNATSSAYALRFKVSGAGSYSYWNAGTSAMQSTIVWNSVTLNPGDTLTVSIPNTIVANGTVYNWSVASQESIANLQGPFATDFVFTGRVAPVVTAVTAPSTTVASVSANVTWTRTIASGAVQTAYRIVAEIGAFGTTPGSGTQIFDSGAVSSSSLSGVANMLQTGNSTRFFVQLTQTGGQVSAWNYITQNVVFDAPALPIFTVTNDTPNGRVLLTAQCRDNVLSANASSIETDATGWTAGGNTNIARTVAQFNDGIAALSLTSIAAGATSATTAGTGLSGAVVQPSTQYTALALFKTAVSARACNVKILWYKASGAASTIRASDTSSNATDGTGGWTLASTTVTSPSDAAFAAIVVTVTTTGAASEVHYVDQVSLAPGASTVWTLGGFVGNQIAVIEASTDAGVTWTAIRWANGISVTATTQFLSVADYEQPAGTTIQYRVRISGTSAGQTVTNANVTGSVLFSLASWWLTDPLLPGTTNIAVNALGDVFDWQSELHAGVFIGLGRSNDIVISDVWGGRNGTGNLVFQTSTPATWVALFAALGLNKTLVLKNPYGDLFYARFSKRAAQLRNSAANSPWREVAVDFSEVDKP